MPVRVPCPNAITPVSTCQPAANNGYRKCLFKCSHWSFKCSHWSTIALLYLLKAKLRHAAETREPYAEFDRIYFTQSSSVRLGTRTNSLVLFVTSTASAAMACPAIAVSFRPIGVLAVASVALISVVASTAARSRARGYPVGRRIRRPAARGGARPSC